MKVLVVGSGPVSSSFIRMLRMLDVAKKLTIHVSDFLNSQDSKEFRQSLFDSKTLYYRQGLGGLGNYWHGVQDVDRVLEFGDVEEASLFKGFSSLVGLQSKTEFVPYSVPRYRNMADKYVSPVLSFLKVTSSGVSVKLNSGKETYDYVFVGVGYGGKLDPLLNSGIVTASESASDHLVVGSTKPVLPFKDNIRRNRVGHFRPYEVEMHQGLDIKISFRKGYGASIVNPKNKAIYLQESTRVVKSLLKTLSPAQVLSSMNLRYGMPLPLAQRYPFYQVFVQDIYGVSNTGGLELNQEVFRKTVEIIKDFDECALLDSFVSAIHLSRPYASTEDSDFICFNSNATIKSPDPKLICVTPNCNFTIDHRHFTAALMRESEICATSLMRVIA